MESVKNRQILIQDRQAVSEISGNQSRHRKRQNRREDKMTADDMLKFIEVLPNLIVYLYPGYILLWCFAFFRGKSLRDEKAVIFRAVIFSYLIVTAVSIIPITGMFWKNAVYIVCAIAAARIFWIAVVVNDRRVAEQENGVGLHGNELEVLTQHIHGAWIAVYLKSSDIVYEGSLGTYSLDGIGDTRKYITVTGYEKYTLEDDYKHVIEDYSENKDTEAMVVLYYDDIERIECFRDKV